MTDSRTRVASLLIDNDWAIRKDTHSHGAENKQKTSPATQAPSAQLGAGAAPALVDRRHTGAMVARLSNGRAVKKWM